jgi:hypothetical protein
MRIKDKGLFVIGVINILLAVIGSIILIVQHRFGRLPLLGLCLATGITSILSSIETKKQRQKRRAELLEKAKLYGWYKED